MELLFLGTGAADWPKNQPVEATDIRRMTSTLLDDSTLIDCGPDAYGYYCYLGKDPSKITDVILSHSHGDHISFDELKQFAAASGHIRFWCDKVAKENKTLSAISIGWDPGVFSIARMLFGAILPDGNDYTFWGKGVSQGHSDAIRRIEGVQNAIQYTIPKEDALNAVRSGSNPNLTTRDKHLRECFVAVKDGANKASIEKQIKEMPNYFADYDTIVNFVSEEEVKDMQKKLAHGGFVFRSGNTTDENAHLLELSLKLDSNPEFTGSVLTAYGRAVAKMAKAGVTGCVTAFDIPLKYLSPESEEDLRAHLL